MAISKIITATVPTDNGIFQVSFNSDETVSLTVQDKVSGDLVEINFTREQALEVAKELVLARVKGLEHHARCNLHSRSETAIESAADRESL